MDVKPKELHRLSTEAYEQLEKLLPASPHVDSETSPLQAGFLLGVQTVLQKLRNGWVV